MGLDLAVLRLPDGRGWLGLGPFSEHASKPADGGFYCNDFQLGDPMPWKRPETLLQLGADALSLPCGALPAVRWAKVGVDGFKSVFRRIRRDVLGNGLAKMVPALTLRGKLLRGDMVALLERALKQEPAGWCYGAVRGEEGFMGVTPELLFHKQGPSIQTMALAGTAKPGEDRAFLTDVKEIDEHELVVSYLESQLQGIGSVKRGQRGLLQTAGLRHFHTPVEVSLAKEVPVQDLIHLLHPTPAVGCLPKAEPWLKKLHDYRTQLGVPGFFGAPFGFCSAEGEASFVVSIRGVGWQGEDVCLPSGCGIVPGSAFDHEWRELRLKRESVAQMLGV